ncbi:MAG TPA: hypothetical protein VMI52_04540 [Acetobacteraceae bacterium]|nr:hypothetical protein [Acetobacteraceae bacterium]
MSLSLTHRADIQPGGRMPPRVATLLSGLIVFLAGLWARLYHISGKPFWMDEITTIQRSSQPLLGVLLDSLRFHHLPAYFVLTSWVVPFGQTEALLRWPSAVFGALACCAVFLVAARLGGRRAGVLAGLLMALSPLQVQYGQEARSYALVTCLIGLGLLGLIELARDPAAAALDLRAPGARRRAWATYTLATLAAANVLSVALMWWLAANLAALAIARHAGAARRGFLRNWALAQAVIAGFTVPWFVAMYVCVHGAMAKGLDWVPPLSAERVWSTVASVYLLRHSSLISGELFRSTVPYLGGVVTLLGFCGAFWLARRRAAMAALGLAFVVLPATLLAVSVVQPVWMPRYALWSAAPFFVFAGLGVRLLPRRAQWPAVAVVAALALLNLRPYYRVDTKPRWDLAAAVLRDGMQAGDLVLSNDPWAVRLMNIYLARSGEVLPPERWTTDVQRATAHLAAGGRVWAVQGRVGQVDHETQDQFMARILPLGLPTLRTQKGLDVIVMRFDPPPRTPQFSCLRRDGTAPESVCDPG